MPKIVIPIEPPEPRSWKNARTVAVVMAFCSFCGGAASFLGWVLDVPRLTNWDGSGVSIQPNAAVAVMASSAAIICFVRRFYRASLTLSGLVALIGLSSVFQIATEIDLGINDLLMFGREWGRVGVIVPGRMGTPGATCWTLIGIGLTAMSLDRLFSLPRRNALLRVGIGFGLTAVAISALSITGYIYGAETLYSLPRLTVIAFQTAIFIFLISVSLLLVQPASDPMRLFLEEGSAGSMMRRLFPAIAVVPIVLGIFRLAGQDAGYFDLAFGTTVRTITEIFLLLMLLWWASKVVSEQEKTSDVLRADVLESSRERLALADAMPQVVWIANGSGDVTYYNRRVREFSGVERTDKGLFRWQPAIHPDDLDSTATAWQNALRFGTVYSHEHRIQMADGTFRWHLSRAVPSLDPDGNAEKWFGTATDIHDIKIIEEDCRQTEERLRLAVEAGDIGIWESDPNSLKLFWDERTRELFGIGPDEDISYDETVWRVIPAEEHSVARVAAVKALDPNGDGIYDMQHRVRLSDGRFRWLHNRGRVEFIEKQGQRVPRLMRGTVIDITERKDEETRATLLARLGDLIRMSDDAEELLYSVAQTIGDSLNAQRCLFNEIDLDARTEVVHRDYFRSGETVIGIHPLDDYSSITIKQMAAGETIVNLDSSTDKRTASMYEKTYGPAGERSYVSVPLLRGGKWVASFWVSDDRPRIWSTSEVRLIEGVAERTWLAVERLRSEIALLKSKNELETRVAERTKELADANLALLEEMDERAASENKRIDLLHRLVSSQEVERARIARDIHDQLGQRLTALRLKIASLKEAVGDDHTIAPRIERLREIGEKLDSEVSFLAWELRPSGLDDLGFVEAIGEYVREWSSHLEMAADFHASDLSGVRLAREAETHLYRIAQEALNNAVKHAEASHIGVLLERRDSHVIMVVEDNGKGFDPLHSNHSNDPSAGLGLVGMKERASLVGGDVEIESRAGAGTTIYVRIPFEG